MAGRIGIIHSASMRVHQIQDPELLATEIISILADVIPHDYGAVYLVREDRLVPFAVSDRGMGQTGLASDKDYLRSLNLKVGENVTGWVALNNKSVIIRDAKLDSRFLDSRPGVRSELCVPMRIRGAVSGVINLEANQAGAYTESERTVLEIIAVQIALSIENANLSNEIERLAASE